MALVIAAMFICLTGYFLKEIQEFSIGGSLIRLREAKSNVEEAIKELNQFRVESFRLFLIQSIEFSGGFGTIGLIDERAEKFIKLYEQIEKANCVEELKGDIHQGAIIILKGQLDQILASSRQLRLKFSIDTPQTEFPEANEILFEVNLEQIEGFSSWDKVKVKSEFDSSIEIYRKLLEIKKKTSS